MAWIQCYLLECAAQKTKNGSPLGVSVAWETHPGKQKNMEDFVVLKSKVETKGQTYLAVFDGHGGKRASYYCAAHKVWLTCRGSSVLISFFKRMCK